MMERQISKERIQEILKNDPLFEIIQGTEEEENLYNDEYLDDINEKKYYSTLDIADWFNVSDGQIRYYIKPLHEYIFDGENPPSSDRSMRLGFKSILRLRMILLLKNEYKVKGLQEVLDLRATLVEKPKSNYTNNDLTGNPDSKELTPSNNIQGNDIDMVVDLFKQLIDTEAFTVEQEDDKYKINLSNNLKNLLKYNPSTMLSDIEEQINTKVDKSFNQLDKENQIKFESLKKQNAYLKDALWKQREFEDEAEVEWEKNNKFGLFARIFKANDIETEKRKFINNYTMKRLREIDNSRQ